MEPPLVIRRADKVGTESNASMNNIERAVSKKEAEFG